MKIILDIPDNTVKLTALVVLKGNGCYEDGNIQLDEAEIKERVLVDIKGVDLKGVDLSDYVGITVPEMRCAFDE